MSCELCGNYESYYHLDEEQYCESCYDRIIYGNYDEDEYEDDEYFDED